MDARVRLTSPWVKTGSFDALSVFSNPEAVEAAVIRLRREEWLDPAAEEGAGIRSIVHAQSDAA